MIITLGEVELGSPIEIGYRNNDYTPKATIEIIDKSFHKVVVAGRWYESRTDRTIKHVLIAHNNDKIRSWSMDARRSDVDHITEYIQDIRKFKFGYWIPSSYECNLLIKQIISPEQKCISCNKNAPHVVPNMGNFYICNFCKVLKELI